MRLPRQGLTQTAVPGHNPERMGNPRVACGRTDKETERRSVDLGRSPSTSDTTRLRQLCIHARNGLTERCIVHFHAPLRQAARDALPMVDQRPNECGSHQCGETTSKGLRTFGNLKAVMLDGYGPNVVFSRMTPASGVIDCIEANFDLSAKTGGPVPC